MMMKKECVCFDEQENRCEAIKLVAFDHGHKCADCVFYKTEETYIKETGMTYKEKVKRDIELYALEHGGR